MTIESQAEEFILSLEADADIARNTVSSYAGDVRRFAGSLADAGVTRCREITARLVASYIERLAEDGTGAAAARACAALRRFFACMEETGAIKGNNKLSEALAAIPAERKLPVILSGGEVEALLGQRFRDDAKGVRDRAMLELLYATGVCTSEFVALDVDDVNLSTGLVRCGVSGKERRIPIHEEAADALGRYMNEVRERMLADPGERALFVNTRGKRITRQGFWKIVRQYQTSAGLTTTVTPRTVRHAFAAHLLENGADLDSLQELMGHSDKSSTNIYARLVKKNLKDIYKTSHPKASV